MSSLARRMSNPIEALKASRRASGVAAKRPPQALADPVGEFVADRGIYSGNLSHTQNNRGAPVPASGPLSRIECLTDDIRRAPHRSEADWIGCGPTEGVECTRLLKVTIVALIGLALASRAFKIDAEVDAIDGWIYRLFVSGLAALRQTPRRLTTLGNRVRLRYAALK